MSCRKRRWPTRLPWLSNVRGSVSCTRRRNWRELLAMEQIPILKVGRCLLISIQIDMHDRLAMALQEDLTTKLVETRARGVLIDISALDLVDSFIGRMLSNIAAMGRVLDAQTVVVGMRPQVAITLVELGLTLKGIQTALDLDHGLALINRLIDGQEGEEGEGGAQ